MLQWGWMLYIPYTKQNMLIEGDKFWKQVQRETKMQKWNYLKQNKDLKIFLTNWIHGSMEFKLLLVWPTVILKI